MSSFASPTTGVFCNIVGKSPATMRLVKLAKLVANSTAPILLVGPPGSEFEVVAEFIHRHSSRAALPLVRQRCVSWQDLADPLRIVGSGTLFVEGVEHASLPVQLRLLHELDEAQLMQLQADGVAAQAPRIIASTTVSLAELIANGLFLDDLYWQFYALSIPIPSLKERVEDIAEIAASMLSQIVAVHRPIHQPYLTDEAIVQLKSHAWPGNFRELHSTLQRAVLLATTPELTLGLDPICAESVEGKKVDDRSEPDSLASLSMLDFAGLVQNVVQRGIVEADRGREQLHQFIVDQVEKTLIGTILAECENVQTKAAARLGINRNTLHKKMKDFGLETTN